MVSLSNPFGFITLVHQPERAFSPETIRQAHYLKPDTAYTKKPIMVSLSNPFGF